MIKILILCKKSETSKSLVNYVISKISILRLVGIANTQTEALKILEEQKPNLIISTDKNILLLVKHNFKHYTPGIILLSKKLEEPQFFYRSLLILQYNLNFDIMVRKIRNFITDNFSVSKKEQIRKILSEIGFNLKLSGTMYLIDSVLYTNTYRSGYSFEKLEKDIYSYIAQKNNSTPKRVKWAIERAINYMYQKQTEDTYYYIEKYFAIEYPQKPTAKLIINTLASIINL